MRQELDNLLTYPLLSCLPSAGPAETRMPDRDRSPFPAIRCRTSHFRRSGRRSFGPHVPNLAPLNLHRIVISARTLPIGTIRPHAAQDQRVTMKHGRRTAAMATHPANGDFLRACCPEATPCSGRSTQQSHDHCANCQCSRTKQICLLPYFGAILPDHLPVPFGLRRFFRSAIVPWLNETTDGLTFGCRRSIRIVTLYKRDKLGANARNALPFRLCPATLMW